jgi:hypothetical protein
MVMALTRGVGSDIKQGVCPSLNKQSFYPRTLVGSVLLIAFFFLPLHFHSLTPTAQLAQECSCYHGVRTQAGLAPVPADYTPTFQASFVVLHEPRSFSRLSIHFHAIRAPPHGISL